MFGKFKGLFSGDAKAPQESPASKRLSQFKRDWGHVRNFYDTIMKESRQVAPGGFDPLDSPEVLARGNLDHHLASMVKLLREEEEESSQDDGTGLCFEYMLQENVLDILCAYGQVNRPPGMMTLVLKTCVLLFSSLHQQLLPHMSVHQPVSQLIRVSMEQCSAESRPHLIKLLVALCRMLQTEPFLAGFFMRSSSHDVGAGASADEEEAGGFLLFDALLPFANLAGDAGDNARLGLLSCLALPNKAVARYVVYHTQFAKSVVEGTRALFDLLPRTVDVEERDLSDLNMFFRRISFLSDVCATAGELVRVQLAQEAHDGFFADALVPALLNENEAELVTATMYVRGVIERVDAPDLQAQLSRALLGDATAPEVRGVRDEHPLRETLIRRMDSVNEALAVATMRLFDALVHAHHEHTLNNLILRNLAKYTEWSETHLGHASPPFHSLGEFAAHFPGVPIDVTDPAFVGYLHDAEWIVQAAFKAYQAWSVHASKPGGAFLNTPASGDGGLTLSEEVEALTSMMFGMPTAHADENAANSPASTPTGGSSAAATPAHSNDRVPRVVDTPEGASLRTPEKKRPARPDGLEPLTPDGPASPLVELSPESSAKVVGFTATPSTPTVHLRYRAMRLDEDAMAIGPTSPAKARRALLKPDTPPAPAFYEGLFLDMLLSKVLRIPERSLHSNLILTGVIGKVAACPDPLLHAYLLNASLVLHDDTRSLPRVLSELTLSTHQHAATMPNFAAALERVKEGMAEEDKAAEGEGEGEGEAAGSGGAAEDDDAAAERRFLEGYLVMEEFVKECAALVHAKHTHKNIVDAFARV